MNLVKENCSSLKCVFFQIHSCISFVAAVPSLSCVPLFVTPWIVAHRLPCPSPSPGASWNSCPLSQWCQLVLQKSCPLWSPSPPALNLSQYQGFFSNESTLCISWPKYWSFSFSISPSNEYAGLISFRIDWIDLLVVQGTLKSLRQTTV